MKNFPFAFAVPAILILCIVGASQPEGQQPVNREIPPVRAEYRQTYPEGYYHVKSAPGQGTATVAPQAGLQAGKMATLTITYTVGEEALQPNDGVLFLIPHSYSRPQHYQPVWSDGGATYRRMILGQQAGFTTATASRPEVKLSFYCDPAMDQSRLGEGSHLFVNVTGSALQPGETITVTYGDTRHGCPGATSFLALMFEIRTIVYRGMDWQAVRRDLASGKPVAVWTHAASVTQIEDCPQIFVDGAEACELVATNPSDVVVGEPFDVSVVARDVYDNVANRHQGLAALIPQNQLQIFGSGAFDPKAGGVARLRASLSRPGLYRIAVRDSAGGLQARGNPIRVHAQEPPQRLYWGDLHTHTVESDGLGTVSWAYRYGRDVADLDFCSITDHLNGLSTVLRENAAAYNWPGNFVTFSAFERSGVLEKGGDLIVYFKDDRVEYENVLPGGMNYPSKVNVSQLAESLQRINTTQNIIVIPHNHAGGPYTELPGFKHPIFRLVEIYSVWGNSEQLDPAYRPYTAFRSNAARVVQDALAMGCRMGIIASGDGHSGRPGYDNWLRVSRSYRSGLVAAPGAALTREKIWDSLWNRHVYGTTGKRILLEFSINGVPMGQTIKARESTMPRYLEVAVEGTDTLRDVILIKNNQELYRLKGEGMSARLKFRDDAPVSKLDYYYVRVVQEPDDLAWSSPIWVEYP